MDPAERPIAHATEDSLVISDDVGDNVDLLVPCYTESDTDARSLSQLP